VTQANDGWSFCCVLHVHIAAKNGALATAWQMLTQSMPAHVESPSELHNTAYWAAGNQQHASQVISLKRVLSRLPML
jgi:hypothetical protein